MDKKQISWKKQIKYLQILFLIFVIIWYYIYNYTMSVYHTYNNKVNELDRITTKVRSLQDKLDKTKDFIKKIKKIQSNKKLFISAYNKCYPKYVLKKYNIWIWNIISLKDCMRNIYKDKVIDDFKDVDLEKIWISFGIYKDNSKKMNFNQKKVLESLDKNIFMDNMEEKVPLLSFSNPILINKELWLYKVSFTFSTKLYYWGFLNLFNHLQNLLYHNNNIYYTINNIWKFDIVKENENQQINIQWSFYFSK